MRILIVLAAVALAIVPEGVQAGCCRGCASSSCRIPAKRTVKVSAKMTENRTAENNGKIGVVSPRKGPDSFLGQKFGDPWPETVDRKTAERGVPFTPKKKFRQFDSYSVVLANGLIKEVRMECDCGSKEAAEAEMEACMQVMKEKYECTFTGTGSTRKAVCNALVRATDNCNGKVAGRVYPKPVMELELTRKSSGVVRVSARTLDKSLFAVGIRVPVKEDAEAL